MVGVIASLRFGPACRYRGSTPVIHCSKLRLPSQNGLGRRV